LFSDRGRIALLVLAVLAGPGAAQEADLKWKFEKGKTFYQEMVINTDQKLTLMGNDIPIKNKQTIITSWTPEKQDKDKNWVVAEKILAMKMDIEMLGQKISYDSTKNAGPPALVDAMKPIIGAEFKATISPEMKTLKVDGYQEFLDKLGDADPKVKQMMASTFSEDTLKQSSDALFALVPAKPVKKGESWMEKSTVPLGALGKLTVERKFTYEGKSGALDKIIMDSKLDKHEPADPKAGGLALPFRLKKLDLKKTTATGTIYFDAAKGRLDSADQTVKLEGSMTVEAQGMEATFDLVQTQTIKIRATDSNPLK